MARLLIEMKLRALSLVHSGADVAIAFLALAQRPFRALRVWAWNKATAVNLATCHERQPRRTHF